MGYLKHARGKVREGFIKRQRVNCLEGQGGVYQTAGGRHGKVEGRGNEDEKDRLSTNCSSQG